MLLLLIRPKDAFTILLFLLEFITISSKYFFGEKNPALI